MGKFSALLNSTTVKYLWLSLKSEKKTVILTILFSAVISCMSIVGISAFLPVISIIEGGDYSKLGEFPVIGKLISFLPSDPNQAILFLVLAILTVIIIRALLTSWITLMQVHITISVEQIWQERVINHWLAMDPLQHTREDRAQIINFCSSETKNTGRAGGAVVFLISSVIQILFVVAFMFLTSWQVVVGIFGFIFLVMLPLTFILNRVFEAAHKDARFTKEYLTRIFDVIYRVDLIDIFSTRKQELDKLNEYLNNHLMVKMLARKINAFGNLVIEVLGGVLICSIILYFHWVLKGMGVSFQYLVVFIGSLVIIQPQLNRLNLALSELSRVGVSFQYVDEFLSKKSLQTHKTSSPLLTQLPAHFDIALQNASFAYERANGQPLPILDNTSVVIPQGKLTMLFGASGAGKTTLLSLLMRLYVPLSGKISIGGIDLEQFDNTALKKMILLMPQDNVVIDGSVKENVTYGNDHITDEDVSWALQLAGATDFVNNLDLGVDSLVGHDGGLLSGGQRQRLCLARVIANKPKIILLDEPTSGLDRFTENEVLNNLLTLRDQGFTIILSTHKIEIATFADQLLWFENGQIHSGALHDFQNSLSQLEYKVKS